MQEIIERLKKEEKTNSTKKDRAKMEGNIAAKKESVDSEGAVNVKKFAFFFKF